MKRVFWILALAGLLCVLAALFVTWIAEAYRRARVTSCAGNLCQFRSLSSLYATQFGPPEHTGTALWKAFTTSQPPLLDSSELEILLCPVKDDGKIGDIQYLGPALPVARLATSDALACDAPGNHPKSGNVLRKSGDVLEYTHPEFDLLLQSPNGPKR